MKSEPVGFQKGSQEFIIFTQTLPKTFNRNLKMHTVQDAATFLTLNLYFNVIYKII